MPASIPLERPRSWGPSERAGRAAHGALPCFPSRSCSRECNNDGLEEVNADNQTRGVSIHDHDADAQLPPVTTTTASLRRVRTCPSDIGTSTPDPATNIPVLARVNSHFPRSEFAAGASASASAPRVWRSADPVTKWKAVVADSINERVAERIASMYRESRIRRNGSEEVASGFRLPNTRIWKPICWRQELVDNAPRSSNPGSSLVRTMYLRYSNSKFARVQYECTQKGRVMRLLSAKFPFRKLPASFVAATTKLSDRASLSVPPQSIGPAQKTITKAQQSAMRLAKRMSKCKDTRGKRYDIKKLRDRRYHAVMKGMTWMYNFLKKNNFKRLYELGDDMPSIFFECWYTSADTRIRTRAKGIAKVLVDKLEAERLQKARVRMVDDGEGALDQNDFFECMFMLRCKHEMGLDCDALLQLADAAYRGAGLADTSKMFECDDLSDVTCDKWLLLLMRVLIVEYLNLMFGNRWPIRWGMKECFLAIRDLPLKTWKDEGEEEEFDDSFYLATHIVFAISAYSATKTNEKDVPWLYAYVRGAFKHWRTFMKHKLPSSKKHDPEYYIDIDALGEILDNLRGAGLNDASDPMVCELSVFLLDNQNENGSFPCWFRGGKDELDNYDKIHSTWVCTQALRDRDFKIKENFRWVQWMNRLLKTTKFGVLNYEPSWKIRRNEFSLEGLTYT